MNSMTRRVALGAASLTGLGALTVALPATASPSYSVVCASVQMDVTRGVTAPFALDCEDSEGAPVDSYVVVTQPTKAAVFTLDAATGAGTYQAAPEATGTDTFTFKGVTELGESPVTTATFTVGNTRPVCDPVAPVSVVHDRQVEVALTCTDADDDTLSIVAGTTGAAHGSVAIVDGDVTYEPAAGYVGSDSFSLRAGDGHLYSEEVTVAVSVTNQAPVCTGSSVSTRHDRSTVIALSCTDADGDAITRSIAVAPQRGTATISGNQVTYRPSSRYLGADTFRVTATDGIATSAQAVHAVNVTNAAPRCSAVRSSVVKRRKSVTMRVTCTDADGDAVALALVKKPKAGKVTIRGTKVTYTAPRKRMLIAFQLAPRDGVSSGRPVSVKVQVR